MASADPDDSSYLSSMVSRKLHDREVLALVNDTIGTLSAHAVQNKTTVLQVLASCHAAMTSKRDDGVMNTVVRDAEYYFIGREGVAQHKWKFAKNASAAYQVMRAAWYDLFKHCANGTHLLESQDHKPNSPAGGSRWAFQGADDGQLDNPGAIAQPKFCVDTPYDSELSAKQAMGDFSDAPPDDLAP
jgi:hypothetical protein